MMHADDEMPRVLHGCCSPSDAFPGPLDAINTSPPVLHKRAMLASELSSRLRRMFCIVEKDKVAWKLCSVESLLAN